MSILDPSMTEITAYMSKLGRTER